MGSEFLKVIFGARDFLCNVAHFIRGGKVVCVLNFHRIGYVDQRNPFHRLHTVSPAVFQRYIRFLSWVGKFVSLDDLLEDQKLGRINFLLTFDDVSRTILSQKDFLQLREIPYTIAPCTNITENGMGWRDKVYLIEYFLDKNEIYNFTQKRFYDCCPSKENFFLYDFSKNNNIPSEHMIEKVIDPLFSRIPRMKYKDYDRVYLSWEEIKQHFSQNPLVTIANHGTTHFKMLTMSQEELSWEVKVSSREFQEKLNFCPNYFVVPFGGASTYLKSTLTNILKEHKYRGVLWTDNRIQFLDALSVNRFFHLSRIHTPNNFLKGIKLIVLGMFSAHTA